MTQIIANGISIEFESHGDVFDPAIVLVRGLGTQLIDWADEFVQGLVSAGYRVVTFDNRDVGLSEKFEGLPDIQAVSKGEQAPPYTIEDMADDIVGLMDSLEIEQAHVFAISMGGMIGQVMAANHGERMLSFMSVMSSSGKPGLSSATPEAMASLSAETDPAAGEAGIIRATAEGLRVCGSPGYPLTEAERIEIARRRFERDYTPDGVVRQMAAIRAFGDRTELLRAIHVPTLVIHGADDPLVPVDHGEDTAKEIPHAELEIIPGMGHDIPPALAPKMIEIVTGFCARAHTFPERHRQDKWED